MSFGDAFGIVFFVFIIVCIWQWCKFAETRWREENDIDGGKKGFMHSAADLAVKGLAMKEAYDIIRNQQEKAGEREQEKQESNTDTDKYYVPNPNAGQRSGFDRVMDFVSEYAKQKNAQK